MSGNGNHRARLINSGPAVHTNRGIYPTLDAGIEVLLPTAPRVELKCNALGFSVPAKGEQKRILHGVSCVFKPGELSALMGPSGSGKTTLLSTLAGHHNARANALTGTLTVNGLAMPPSFKQMSCLIPQDDVLHAGLTPREALGFAADLRLSCGKAARRARVEQLIEQLGLAECCDTRIGNVDRRGISGGQRKRVSVGLELVTDPAVILVDEATSGLDSKMAEDVIDILHKLARSGRTVVCTIHQPSYRIFATFDKLVMLARGRLCYAGSVEAAPAHFKALHLALPSHENPADVYMRWLQARARSTALDLGPRGLRRDTAIVLSEEDEAVLARLLGSAEDAACAYVATGAAEGVFEQLSAGTYAISRTRQFVCLTRREFVDNLKDRNKFIKTFSLKVFVGFLVGIVWFRQAGDKLEDVFPVQGCIYVVVYSCVMDTIMATALELPRTRSILIREYRNGWYALPAHQLAILLTLCSLMTVNTLGLSLPIYFLVGLRLAILPIVVFVGTLALLSWIGVAFGLCIGAIVNDLKQAQSVIAPTLVPLLLFSGYLIPYAQIPVYFQWLYYVSFFQYAMAILEVNEFMGRRFDSCVSHDAIERLMEQLPASCYSAIPCIVEGAAILSKDTCFKDGEDLLRRKLNIDPGQIGRDYAILGATFVVFAVASYYLTRRVIRFHY